MTPQPLPASPSPAGSNQPDYQAGGVLAALLAATVGASGKNPTGTEGFESLFTAPAETEETGTASSTGFEASIMMGAQVASWFVPAAAEPVVSGDSGCIGPATEEPYTPAVGASPSPLLPAAKAASTNPARFMFQQTHGDMTGPIQAQPGASMAPTPADPAVDSTTTVEPISRPATTPVAPTGEKTGGNATLQPTESSGRWDGAEVGITTPAPESPPPVASEPQSSVPQTSLPGRPAGPVTDGTEKAGAKLPDTAATRLLSTEPPVNTAPSLAGPRSAAETTLSSTGMPANAAPANSGVSPGHLQPRNPTVDAATHPPSTPLSSMPEPDARVRSDAVSALPIRANRTGDAGPANPIPERAAKFTQLPENRSAVTPALGAGPEKSTLRNLYSTVKQSSQAVGTDAAVQSAPMPAATLQRRSSLAESMDDPSSTGVAPGSAPKDTTVVLPREPVPAANQVLATVLKIISQPDKPERSHVDLQFSFGRDTVAVRVGLKAGEVQTVFQTSSSELRTALAQQWHDYTGHLPETARTLAEPVFTHTSAAPANFAQNDGSSGRQPAPFPEEHPREQNAPTAETEPEPQEPATLPRPAPGPISRQLLNTLA